MEIFKYRIFKHWSGRVVGYTLANGKSGSNSGISIMRVLTYEWYSTHSSLYHSVGNPVVGLGWPRMLDWQAQYWIQMASFGRDQLLGPLGGLYQGTNELIGEDLGIIIRLVPVQ